MNRSLQCGKHRMDRGCLISTNRMAFLLAALALALLSPCAQALAWDHDTVREPRPDQWQDDAELTDVYFIDLQHGWAVGEQGTILRTTDGGQNWTSSIRVQQLAEDDLSLEEKLKRVRFGQSTPGATANIGTNVRNPIRCRLESVHFANSQHGWAVGGYELPYVDRSRAVVLRTVDGGETWDSVEGLMTPRFRRVQFNGLQRGLAVGDRGNLAPSGIYVSNNGGKSWSSESVETQSGWRDAQIAAGGYAALDRHGRLYHVAGQTVSAAPLVNLPSDVRFSQLTMIDGKTGFAVGSHGSIARTSNGGETWSGLNLPAENHNRRLFDFTALACQGDTLWVAGNPGCQIFRIDLKTMQVTAAATPVTTKLNQINFIDAQHGWAVGEMGVVLATQDGGLTWEQQRGSTQSLALLSLSEQPVRTPLQLLSQYAGEENLLCGQILLSASPFARVHQAATRLGCSVNDIVHSEPVLNRTQPPSWLPKLVLRIRSLRPAVVVCNGATSHDRLGEKFSPDGSTQHWMKQAVKLAADPTAFPEQLELPGLQVHSVSRLATEDKLGPLATNPQRLLATFGDSIEDRIALSRALLGLELGIDKPRHYQVQTIDGGRSFRGDDLMFGLPAQQNSRRTGTRLANGSLSAIRSANQRRQKLDEFAQFEVQRASDVAVWRRNVEAYLNPLDPQLGGSWLIRLTERYLQQGKSELAAQSGLLLITRWPESPYTLSVMTWLASHYSSNESGQLAFDRAIKQGFLDQRGNVTEAARAANRYATAPIASTFNGDAALSWSPVQAHSNRSEGSSSVARAALEADAELGLSDRQPKLVLERLRTAAQILTAITQRDPDFGDSRTIQWQEAQLARRLGSLSGNQPTSTANRMKQLLKNPPASTESSPSIGQQLRLAAQRELALMEPADRPATVERRANVTAPALAIQIADQCWLTDQRPHLDGKLDDSVWRLATEAVPGNDPSGNLWLARDEEYLYLAIRCPKIPDVNYQWNPQPRPRDAELDRRDRIEIQLDTDRDYQTTFRLEVDHRGWANESCGQVRQWDPNWYISQSETARDWTIEAAIPLRELVAQKISPTVTCWAIQAQRHLAEKSTDQHSPLLVRAPQVDAFELLEFPASSK